MVRAAKTKEPQGEPRGRPPTLTPNTNLVHTAKKPGPPAFRVYDMPPEVFSRFISYTKEHAGNKAWVAIDQLLVYANIANRLDSMEKRIAALEGDK